MTASAHRRWRGSRRDTRDVRHDARGSRVVVAGAAPRGRPGARAGRIAAALDDALLVRPALGWRPFPDAGLELYLGYAVATLGGGTTKGELAGAEFAGSGERITVSGKAHAIHAVIGWRWVVGDRFLVRAGLGYANVLGSDVSVGDNERPLYERSAREIEAALEDHVQTLELRLTVGLRL